MKKFNITLAVAVFFLGGFLLGQSITPTTKTAAPVQQQQQAAQNVSFMFIMDDATIVTTKVPWQANQSLLDATKAIATQKNMKFETKDYGSMGTLVTQIGDKKNGDGNRYWQYWVNGEEVQTAVNAYIVKPGDVISWQFRKSTY